MPAPVFLTFQFGFVCDQRSIPAGPTESPSRSKPEQEDSMKKLLIVAALATASLLAPAARAAVIYNGGPPNEVSASVSAKGQQEAAESFTLSDGAHTLNDVHWWGICLESTCPAGNFTVSFYNDNGGLPGTLIESFALGNANQTATGSFLFGGDSPEYAYSTEIPELILAPGTRYWLGISNLFSFDGVWAWEWTNQGGVFASQAEGLSGTWHAEVWNLAFFLTGPVTAAVPEPASLALLGSSLLGFAAIKRSKKAG